jgi:CcmD family protein
MTMLNRICGCVLAALWLGVPLAALQPPTGAATDGFVPLDSLPPQEQLPAAPLLIAAYVFVWLLLMLYVWSIARRLGKVENDIQVLQRRTPGSAPR